MKQHNLFINGISGKMGQTISSVLEKSNRYPFQLISGSSQKENFQKKKKEFETCDLLFDFSSSESNELLLQHLSSSTCDRLSHVLVGTTGILPETITKWKKLSLEKNIACLFAPNTSLGIHLMLQSALMLSSIATTTDFDIEIEETHHRQKKDSPSGTANYLAKKIANQTNFKINTQNQRTSPRPQNEINIHSIRGGGVFGEHKIRFLGEHEEIMISHRAFSRNLFAKGALILGNWLVNQKEPGIYEPSNINFSDMR